MYFFFLILKLCSDVRLPKYWLEVYLRAFEVTSKHLEVLKTFLTTNFLVKFKKRFGLFLSNFCLISVISHFSSLLVKSFLIKKISH